MNNSICCSKPSPAVVTAYLTSLRPSTTGIEHRIRVRFDHPCNYIKFHGIRASAVDSPESSSEFVKRMEQAWSISQQPRPIACSSCDSLGRIECKWCRGTGFFILGDNMLCQVPSRNTTCVICAGEGSMSCSDCKGTGFRAKWLGDPPINI